MYKKEELITMIKECSDNGWKNSDLFDETEKILDMIVAKDYHGWNKDLELILSKLNNEFDKFNLMDVESIMTRKFYFWYYDKKIKFETRLTDDEILNHLLKDVNKTERDMGYELTKKEDYEIISKLEFKEFENKMFHVNNGTSILKDGVFSEYTIKSKKENISYKVKKVKYLDKKWEKVTETKIHIDII